MKKIYFGINGQFGDIIIQEPTLRKIIKLNPDAEIYMGAYKKYFEILDVYRNYHENIKGFIEWERYTTRYEKNGDGHWPSEKDKKVIEKYIKYEARILAGKFPRKFNSIEYYEKKY